jgi:hypothetical protein
MGVAKKPTFKLKSPLALTLGIQVPDLTFWKAGNYQPSYTPDPLKMDKSTEKMQVVGISCRELWEWKGCIFHSWAKLMN